MKSKIHFYFNVLGYLALSIGCILGYWGVATALFYFVIEIGVNSVVTAFVWKVDGKKKRTFPILLAGGVMVYLGAIFATFLAVFAGEKDFFYVDWIDPETKPYVKFLIVMSVKTYPLIIYRSAIAIYEVWKLPRIELENKIFSELIHNILSLLGIFVLTYLLMMITGQSSVVWILISIIIFRILLDLYLYRSVLGWKKSKQTK